MNYRDIYISGRLVARDYHRPDGTIVRALPFNKFGGPSINNMSLSYPNTDYPHATARFRG